MPRKKGSRNRGFYYWVRPGQSSGWYINQEGKKVLLLRGEKTPETRKQAEQLFHAHKLKNPEKPIIDGPSIDDLAKLYLDHLETDGKHAASSVEVIRSQLASFTKHFGDCSPNKLEDSHLDNWVKLFPSWSDQTKMNQIARVKTFFNWIRSKKIIKENPFQDRKMGSPHFRSDLLPGNILELIKPLVDPSYFEFFQVFHATGVRQGDIANLTAADCKIENNFIVARFTNHKTASKTRSIREITFQGKALEIVSRLLKFRTSGPLFLDSRGKKWESNAWGRVWRRIRGKLGLPKTTVSYAGRHTAITDLIAAGVPDVMVAKMVGTSVEMIKKHYLHLRPEDTAAALAKIRA